jgi:hypothetical protein
MFYQNWGAVLAASMFLGCGASAPSQHKSLVQKVDDPSQSLVVLAAFEGTRSSKFSGFVEIEMKCSISLLPTASNKFWLFSQSKDGPGCWASQVVVDVHGTVIRFNYVLLSNHLTQSDDWAPVNVRLGLAKSLEVRTMRLAVPSPIVRRAQNGESVAEVDGQRTLIRKEVTKDGVVLRTGNRADLHPFSFDEEQYGFIPTGEVWVKDGTYEATTSAIDEHERIIATHEATQQYHAVITTVEICEEGAPEECPAQADAALSLGERAMALQLVEAGCAQNHGDSCERLGVYQQQGIGGKANEAMGLSDLKKGCKLGSGAACYGASLSPELDRPAQKAALEKGCDLGSAHACAAIGRNLASVGEVNEGLKVMQSACDADFLSCDILFESQIEFQKGSAQVQGAENLAKLCPTKWQACEKALRFPDLLDEETFDEVAGVEREVSAKACGQGEAAACYRQGTLFLDGLGGEVETAKGLDSRRKACEMADYLCEKSSDK